MKTSTTSATTTTTTTTTTNIAHPTLSHGRRRAGKPKWQVLRDYADAQRKIDDMEKVIDGLKHRARPEPKAEQRETPVVAQAPGGCKCVVM